MQKTLHEKPAAGSIRKMARVVGLSYTSVQRIWKVHEFKPQLVKIFKLSNDKRLVEKVRDIVGLYLDPPDKGAGVFGRREDPDPGARSHATRFADQERPGLHHNALPLPGPGSTRKRFFGLITGDRIRCSVFRGVAELEAAIQQYLEYHNADPKPFVWTKSATEILGKVAGGKHALESEY